MIWVAWRQQRIETLIAAAIVALLAAVLIPSGIHMASAYDRDGLAACVAHPQTQQCNDAISSFGMRFDRVRQLFGWATLLPGLIGALLAAPLVLSLEHGTFRLDWTQSITRQRWLAHKLGLAVGVAVLVSLALTAVGSWWFGPLNRLEGRLEGSAYDAQGIVVFGYTLFALGLGLAVGVLVRRSVLAVVAAFIGYFAARLFVELQLRQNLLTPKAVTWRGGPGQPSILNHAWILDTYPSNALGHVVSRPCGGVHRLGAGKAVALPGCLDRAPAYMHAVFQPASRFWALQGIETAIFGLPALALIAFAAYWTLRRVA